MHTSNHHHPAVHSSVPRRSLRHSRVVMGLLVAAAILAGYFLWTGHRLHLIQWGPYALLLACPLMHLFMHRGHGGHGRGPHSGANQDGDNDH